jgi:hypothetical protein
MALQAAARRRSVRAPLLVRAVEAVPLSGPGKVFLIADYGVAGVSKLKC